MGGLRLATDGNTVLDIGFGGGVSLGLLAEIVGQTGHIIASDPSISGMTYIKEQPNVRGH